MKVLTVDEVAKFLGIHRLTVYEKARKGEIPAVRVGRNWRILKEELESWLRKNIGKNKGAWKHSRRELKTHKPKQSRNSDPLLKVMGSCRSSGDLTNEIDKEIYK